MHDIPDDLKTKYFDIIYEFGLKVESGPHATKKLMIPVAVKDKAGNEFRGTFHGDTVEEVCAAALVKLEEYGWVGHMEQEFRGLKCFAQAIVNTICGPHRRAEIYFAPGST